MADLDTRRDRARGCLLGGAVGDALGAPYEFRPPVGPDAEVGMVGGGTFGWEPGEWTDDTAMAVAIAEVAATGVDLRELEAQSRIVRRWAGWARDAPDVGLQTKAVLSAAERAAAGGLLDAEHARAAASNHHEQHGRSGGNGSLMRTGPVALAYLDDEPAVVEAATMLSELTHADPEAGEACVLWCLAVRRAVRTGEIDLRAGLAHLHAGRADVWRERIEVAERSTPTDFRHNGWVVEALQSAWSAITITRGADDHLAAAIERAVRGGYDTDTVAAIAGSLLGAAYGASAVPPSWRAVVHGWPGLDATGLEELADPTVR